MGKLNAVQGSMENAARMWGAAEKLREAVGMPLPPYLRIQFERDLPTLRSRVGEETWAAAWEEGRAMTTEEAVRCALGREALD
jgi:hypothetical protein